MTIEERAEEIADSLSPTDGFWKGSTYDVIFESATELLESGWTSQKASEFIQNIMNSIRDEYGE